GRDQAVARLRDRRGLAIELPARDRRSQEHDGEEPRRARRPSNGTARGRDGVRHARSYRGRDAILRPPPRWRARRLARRRSDRVPSAPMRAVSVLGLACLGAGLLLPAHAFAQAHATPPEAVQFFESAREHYRRGRYPEAAVDLERAVMLDPTSPTLRYNLGRVYELLGQLPEARAQYARY